MEGAYAVDSTGSRNGSTGHVWNSISSNTLYTNKIPENPDC